jgi:ATP-dependent DNA helicase DinG
MPSAAELFSHHAFIDLETTGLDPASDEVIEVGVLLVEKGEVVERLSGLFKASAPLPLAIRRLTGLCDDDLAGQPAFSTFLPTLRDALRGWTVVAHNAAFERGFLSELLESISAPVLDSCELLHYLYPERESHSLEAVVRWTGVGERARHRALADCEDTFAALRRALDQVLEEARAEDLVDLLDCLSSSWRQEGVASSPVVELLRGLHARCAGLAAPLELVSSSTFLPTRPERRRRQPAARRPDDEAPPLPVTDPEVDAVLGPGGALERHVEGFRSRPEQGVMARGVARTLSEGGVLAVEAGTGTGKSLAYLAPAALFAARNGRKVAVAPHTKTLQDQLIDKDLPRLHRALEGGFGYAVLKGQNNYLCRRRALEVTRVRDGMSYEERAPRAYLRAWLRRSADGDVDRLSHWFKESFPQLGTLLTGGRSEAATTLGDTCPHYRRCFYHSAVAQAKEADVLVINQALALAWPQRYPRLDELVLDEAHELEDVATTALSAEVSDTGLFRLTERLLGRAGRGGGLASDLRHALSGPSHRAAVRAFIRELEQGVQATLLRSQALGEALEGLCDEGAGPQDADPSGLERRIDAPVRATPAWAGVVRLLRELHAQVEGLAKKLSVEVRASFPDLASRGGPALERELAGAALELQEVAALLAELIEEPPHPSRCYAVQVRPDRGSWTLSAQPVDVSGFFKDQLAQAKRALVLTSATLTAGPQSPWVLERLGMAPAAQQGAPRFVRARSPFDLPRQALVVLVTDAPRAARDEAFVDWSAQRISGLAQFMGGRVLGLFSSNRRLERIGEKVRAQLEPAGIEVLRQSRGHARSLVARQEQDFGSVLLGTKSFWQGVDIPGLGVGLVFIDKLPIEPQSRPIVAAREERWSGSGRGYQGFLHYRLPRALLQLRQGVGRLIRSHQDRGVVVIADPGHPSYRAQVLEALAGYRVEALPWELARVRLFHTLKAMGLESRNRRPALHPEVPGRLAR